MDPKMTFNEALKRLNIEDFRSRIWNSNSHGELMHLLDYIQIASMGGDLSWFRPVFLFCVEFAEKTWKRPESCFQHMPALISSALAPEPEPPAAPQPSFPSH